MNSNLQKNDDKKSGTRLLSLDTLRGFDMLFIMRADAFFMCLGGMFPGTLLALWGGQMEHVAWNGFAFYDLIFPMFLFIAGISFPFSLSKSMGMGADRKSISMKIVRRGLTLVLLGILYNGLLDLDFENLRYASVLGRIGMAWMLAALLYVWTSRRVCVAVGSGILMLYWAMLALLSAPDYPDASSFSMEGSIAGYIDRLFLPGKLHLGIHDPEGLLSTLPAVATALMGILTGEFIRSAKAGGHGKSAILFLLGLAFFGLGWLWDIVLPVNKNLWTSSFVLVAGGLSMMLFSTFYWVVDVMQWRKWTLFFRVVGMNSIAIYLAQHFLDAQKPLKTIFGGVLALVPENLYALAYWTAYVLVWWLFLYFLYRHRIFLKV
ncbi:MAG: DUF5009 domain-containing protein [Bacteroidaceae bacterium]|nr:DUF5009 domain-containing protein [Bacteroidaceae bacterium]